MKMQPATYALRRKSFAMVLRHPELWPVGFRWNYTHSRTCAMGLCSALGYIKDPQQWLAQRFLGLTDREAEEVFIHANAYRDPHVSWLFTTPEMVAEVLERKDNNNGI